ncbi:VOC family protein [Streptomyces mirabilis]|uniref:VOC family protein n=1 Tax=Streptomyces mirabilis TaxID=68239 RepID=UPI0036B3A38D
MNATTPAVQLTFAALNFDCADPAVLADFWGKVLGRPAGPGSVEGDWAVGATEPELGPRMVFHPVAEPKTVNNVRPILLTDHYEDEIARVTGLGAKPLSETKLPQARYTTFTDPEGNDFDLVHWHG